MQRCVTLHSSACRTFKPRDVEEPVDLWINRPLAGLLVKALAPLPITPNQVTVLSGVVGLVAGVLIATAPLRGGWQIHFAGVVLYLSVLLDCADGQLARLRGQSSMLGRTLDGLVDVFAVGAVFIGFAVFYYRAGCDFWLVNAVGWAAGYSMKVHVHAYDHAKNIFLANTRPESERAAALPTLEEIGHERDRLRARGDRIGAWALPIFMHLTVSQRRGWQEGRIGLGTPGTRTDDERAIYRQRFARTMQLWRWNGLGTHHVLLVGACILTPIFREAFVVTCFILIFPMNAFWAYIVWKEKSVERELQAEIRAEAPSTG